MFGSHLSIAGGMHLALLEAQRLGMQSVQVFTKNQQQWKAPALPDESIKLWKDHAKTVGFTKTVSHASYLINLGSPDDVLWEKSIGLFVEELRRCVILGIPFLVAHPGAHMGAGEEAGIERIANGLNAAFKQIETKGVTLCLEITAGQGSSLGHRLEQLQAIAKGVDRKTGVCLDTAHLFAAGYDFRGRKFKGFLNEVDKTIGLDAVKVVHLNDSKKELGSRVDRHEHIGLGTIGVEGFKGFVKEKVFRDVPKILETPKGKDAKGKEWDTVNLTVLRGLI